MRAKLRSLSPVLLVASLLSTACASSKPASGPDGGDDTGALGDSATTTDGTPLDDTGAAGDGGSCAPFASRSGEGTYYAATGAGACSFDPSPSDLLVAALNAPDWSTAALCGACAEVRGPKGTVTVRIVDECPECKTGDLDLSESAFAKIADMAAGRVPIAWNVVPCAVSGPVVYHFKEGSNQWWSAVQIRQHALPIAKLEWQSSDGAWHAVARVDYNYFVEPSGMGPGPYTFRVTDVRGGTVVDTGIPFVEAGDAPGKNPLPPCP